MAAVAATRILVVNPNTTAAVTEQVLRLCRARHPGTLWQGATAAFGAPYIATEAAYAVAAHAAMQSCAEHLDGHDAVLVACFGDPGLLALQELLPVPVLGLATASLAACAARGRFAVVTGGTTWGPMLSRFARAHRLDTQLAAIETVALTGAEIAADPPAAMALLERAARRGVAAGAQQLLLGGAALAGLAEPLQARLGFPVHDNVALAADAVVQAAQAARDLPQATAPTTAQAPLQGVGTALQALVERQRSAPLSPAARATPRP